VDASLIAVASWLARQHIYNMGYDTWMHLAIIQRGAEGGLFTGDPYYPNFPTPLHYSIVHVFYTLLTVVSGISPHQLWGTLSPVFVALIFLASVWWYRELLGDSIFGWLAGLFFLLSIPIIWHYATYPRNVALIFFALNHLFYFRSVRTQQDKYILYSGVAFGFCIISHLFAGIMCLISLMTYILVHWSIDAIHGRARSWKADLRCLAYIPIGFVVASPWLIAFGGQALTHDQTSIAHYSLPSVEAKATIMGWTFTRYKPLLLWDAFPMLLWVLAGVGLLICLYYIVRGSYQAGHIFLVTAAILSTVVLLTPLYSLITHIFGAWMPSRFMNLLPVPAMAALGCQMLLRLFASIRATHRLQQAISRSLGILIALIAMIILIPPIITKQKGLYTRRNRALTPLHTWDTDFNDLRNTLKDKVVLSDPWTSYFLTYYTSAYAVAIPAAHGSPYINHEARLAHVSAMFDPKTNSTKRLELMDDYRIEYVLLNLRPKLDSTASRYGLIGNYYPASIKEVFDQQDSLELVYDRNGLFVYAVRCYSSDICD